MTPQELADRIVERAAPGEQLEAYVASGTSTSVRVYGGEVEAFTVATSRGVGIRVIRDGRQGFAYAGTHDESAIDETLADARDNATFGEPDPHNGLAEPDGHPVVEHDHWRDELEQFPEADKIALAIELERRVLDGDPRIKGVRTASYGDGAGHAAVASTTGIRASGRGTSCSVSVSALAEDGAETQTGFGADLARSPLDLDIDLASGDAVERATRLLGATQPESGRIAIVLEPRIAASIIGLVGGMLTGDRVLKGRSPFADRRGEAIASDVLTIVDDPTDERSLGADANDAEGLACRRNTLVDGGVLNGFLHNAYTGRRSGEGSTASGVRGFSSTPGVGAQALAVAPGTGTLDELIAGVDHGLLVSSMSGLHSGVNPVSGDFSVGVEGLMIRNGAVAEPVREATIASTLQKMLTTVVAVGADLEWQLSGTGAVTLVIGDVSLSGK